jgi:hypothetical protein
MVLNGLTEIYCYLKFNKPKDVQPGNLAFVVACLESSADTGKLGTLKRADVDKLRIDFDPDIRDIKNSSMIWDTLLAIIETERVKQEPPDLCVVM